VVSKYGCTGFVMCSPAIIKSVVKRIVKNKSKADFPERPHGDWI
jgi:hypothetical protein